VRDAVRSLVLGARCSRAAWLPAVLVIAGMLAGCGGSGSPDQGSMPPPPGPGEGDGSAPQIALVVSGPEGLTAGNLALVSSTRVGRTLFEYVYTVRATNSGTEALMNVTGAVTSSAATTVVSDASLAFGNLAAGGSAQSTDTFSIRQDRSAPLSAAQLTITLSADAVPPGPAEGVLLPGDPSSSALAALSTVGPAAVAPGNVLGDTLLTRLDVALNADATVGEINAALSAIGAGIVTMRAGLPTIVLGVPRQADGAGLQALADELATHAGILLALPARQSTVQVAPPAPADDETAMLHLQIAHFPAAWNARALAGSCTDKVRVIVADHYRRPIDPLYADFATQVPNVTDLGSGSTPANDDDLEGAHGYDVMLTLAAALDSISPTGAMPFPECLDASALQTYGLSQYDLSLAIQDAAAGTGKTIVNVSLGYPACDENQPCDPANPPPRAVDRAAWGALQRALLEPVEERVLVATSAGNEADTEAGALWPGVALADYGSALNVAARSDSLMTWIGDASLWDSTDQCTPTPCFPSLRATPGDRVALDVLLQSLQQTQAPPAPGVIVVGSSDRLLNSPSAFSNPEADVYAVGEGIPTLTGIPIRGTSFAAPQVAGLAAYLWMLSPDLRARPVADTIAAIEAHKRIFPVDLIDAYATVLSLDPDDELSASGSRVRLALVDADGNGRFDEADLQQFHEAYRPGGLAIDPSTQDYSRFDLNGDGYTGGTRSAGVDLDPTGSTQFGARSLTDVTTEVFAVERTFDEGSVTDADALCFWANTALYSGDALQRESILLDLCSGALVGTLTVTADGDGYSTRQTWHLRLIPRDDGFFDAQGTVDFTETISGLSGDCSTSLTSSGTLFVNGYRTLEPGDTAGTLTAGGVVHIVHTNSCGGNSEFDDLGGQEIPSFVHQFLPGDITAEFDGGDLVALVWNMVEPASFSRTTTGRLDLIR
jgi:hypothetical protein